MQRSTSVIRNSGTFLRSGGSRRAIRWGCITALSGALTGVAAPAFSATAAPYHPAEKVPVFMGGERDFVGASRARTPGALRVRDFPADVGYVREILPEFKSAAAPFGMARQLEWTGTAHAEYVFRKRSEPSTADAAGTRSHNTFLVFNLRQSGGSSSDVALSLRREGRGPECRRTFVLPAETFARKALWRTYRIPLSDFRGASHCAVSAPECAALVFENEGHARLTIDIADIRWETYPEGWTFAESLAEDLLREMTIEEKIGQMAQLVHRAGNDAVPVQPADVTRLKLGSLFGDSGAPPHDQSGNLLPDTPEVWTDFLDAYQRAALDTDKAIPILIGMDAVHGVALIPGATVFPHNIGLGAANDPALAEAIARATALEAAALGIRLTFAPTLAVARDERWGRTYESLSELPEVVTELGTALTRGYQGRQSAFDRRSRRETLISRPEAILATPKHFGGDGAGTFVEPVWCTALENCGLDSSTDRTNTDLDEDALIALHLYPYLDSINAGAGVIMSSDARWKGDVITGSRRLLTEILKEQFGFDGVLLTDFGSWANVVPGDLDASMLQSLNAGHDLLMLPTEDGYDVLDRVVRDGLATGSLSADRVDDAVRRVLRQKFELGLFDVPFAQRPLSSEVGSAAHHALARRAVQQSLVLLKNQPPNHASDRRHRFGAGPVLPLPRRANVYVAGKGAHDIGLQSGGWTGVWQGILGNALPGTSVLQGIQEHARGDVVYSADATLDTAGSDVGVIVVGEYPYAEFCGDVLGKTFFCEFSRVNPPGLTLALPDVGLPVGLPPPQTMSLTTSSFDYFSPFVGDMALPVAIDPLSDLDVIDRVCSRMPCVVVLLSGRPLFIEDALERADAFVAAWLPGAEGAGVADVLYAHRGARFSGKLQHTWPRTPRNPQNPALISANPERDYVPQNAFVAGMGNLDHVLFPVGYGLTYR